MPTYLDEEALARGLSYLSARDHDLARVFYGITTLTNVSEVLW